MEINYPKISVIVPCRNEEKYIRDFIISILGSDYPKKYLEVFFIDGKSTDSTQELIKSFIRNNDYIRLIQNEKKTVPNALNLGIEISKGDYIFILGAHSRIPSNYFTHLIDWSKKLGADNIGAVCKTDVLIKNKKTESIVKVLSHKFGVGNSLFRVGADKVIEVDNISFGCYKKEIYDRIGQYDVRLKRNQDIELNKRLKKKGGKIFLVPDIYFVYLARETFIGIAKNNFQTGLWNILTVYYTGRLSSLSLRHFIPLLFILSLIAPLILIIWLPKVWLISLSAFLIYSIVLLVVSIRISENIINLPYIIWAFVILHFSYGFGSLIGLFRLNNLFSRLKFE